MVEEAKVEIYGMHPVLEKSKSSSVLKLSADAIEVYCQYEALDFSLAPRELWKHFQSESKYEVKYKEEEEQYPHFKIGIFAIPFAEPDLQAGRALDAYKTIMRWASSSWRYCIRWMLVYISRRVSGITKAEDVAVSDKVMHKCSGYYGWGKIALLLDPEDVCERVRSEFTNLSIVSALFLTITVPLLTTPPDAILQFNNETSLDWLTTDLIQTFYVMACSAAVACQAATAICAVSMITNLNKCQAAGGETGVMFIKSIFNPYNGLTGVIGPVLYIGAMASGFWTMWVTVFTCAATFNSPIDIWIFHFILMFFVLIAFFMQLGLGIMAEFHVMTPELNTFAEEPNKYIDKRKEEKMFKCKQ